jgi:hypothetical protein
MVQAPISFGELVDKLTILDIKLVNITDAQRLKNVQHEFNTLTYIAVSSGLINKPGFEAYYQELVAINTSIWNLENQLRQLMYVPTTDAEFIDTAVYIHRTNDRRAEVKKKINLAWDSHIVEEKSF